MTKQETQKYFEEIMGSLEQKRLKHVFDLLQSLFSHLQNWQLQEKLNSLQDTYKMMLRYQIEGVNDPGREKVYRNLVRSVYQIADAAVLEIKSSNDNSLFYERRRACRYYVPETPGELIRTLEDILGKITLLNLLEEDDAEKIQRMKDLEKQKENLGCKIFYAVWLSNAWTSDEKKQWSNVLNQPDLFSFPSLIITGITLNLLETFDEKKAVLLFETAQNKDEEIRERALTGIVLFLRKYNDRLYLYPEIKERLNLLAEDPKFIRRIRHILLQFILSRETEKITRKITDELIPEMVKISPKTGNKINLSELMSEAGIDDKNPEWQSKIEKAGLQDKLQELSELQMEGADVMHSSFIHLKNYPFFSEPGNWFVPFSIPAEAIGNEELTRLSDVLAASTILCNSDKYSFYLSVSQMPENYRKMMIGQFSKETDNIKEILKEDLQDESKTINYRARQYIQDLYRFYKLHPARKGFEDIFEIKPEFYKVPLINQLIKDNDSLLIIGEYYFTKNYFEDAVDVFNMLLQTDPNNDILYQKKGYCQQMTGNQNGALDAYQKAELLNANSSWTIKKLAHCHRILRQPQDALHYYKKAEQLNPDNLTIQLNIGHCYLELKNYDQALKYYFKVEYLIKNKGKAWRAIGWCSFLVGKYRQALDYFNKTIESNPTSTDYLNAGHAHLALRNNKEAVRLYKLALEKGNHTPDEFIDLFSNDIPDLIAAGINEEDIPFILDSSMYL
jgi:tetratricopeptide (TPR) repeat protein